MAKVTAGGVPFQEAIDFYRRKVDLPTRGWTDLWQGQHARAFVVAGAIKADLVADFHDAINRALKEGRTLADFRKDFDAIVARYGWSHNGSPRWRSSIIFNTNLRMAHASGRWAQIQRVKKRRPYLRYVAVLDSRTRPDHHAWHGTVLPADDAWWSTHYPPNGWNCRCTVQSLSERDLKRHGYTVASPPPVKMERRTINTPNGPATVEVPEGIDTGFAYNVGEAAWGRGADLVAQEKHGPWDRMIAPGGPRPADPGRLAAVMPDARLGARAKGEAELRAALKGALGGDERIFTDPAGGRLSVGQGIVDHMLAKPGRLDGREIYFPLIPELVENPAEIWAGFAVSSVSGRVMLRRRYVRLFDLGRNQVVALVADADGGTWSGYTFLRGGLTALNQLRWGLRIYKAGK